MKHTQETKELISKKRKEYLRENPNKHPWKRSSKFKSKPCEVFKNKLKKEGIEFLEEFQPLDDRFFSIDVAFPIHKIAIEINGNQHYDKEGNLTPYYQERHNLIEKAGWKVYEYHYSVVYDNSLCQEIIRNLKEHNDLEDVDYSFFIKEKHIHKCVDCDKEITSNAKRCSFCENQRRVKVRLSDRPSLEELENLVKEKGYCATGRMFGVTDNAVRKWIKTYKKYTP